MRDFSNCSMTSRSTSPRACRGSWSGTCAKAEAAERAEQERFHLVGKRILLPGRVHSRSHRTRPFDQISISNLSCILAHLDEFWLSSARRQVGTRGF